MHFNGIIKNTCLFIEKRDLHPLLDVMPGPLEGPRRQVTQKMTIVSHFRDAKYRLRVGLLSLAPHEAPFSTVSQEVGLTLEAFGPWRCNV